MQPTPIKTEIMTIDQISATGINCCRITQERDCGLFHAKAANQVWRIVRINGNLVVEQYAVADAQSVVDWFFPKTWGTKKS